MTPYKSPRLCDEEIKYIAPKLHQSEASIKAFAGWLACFHYAVGDASATDKTVSCPIAFLANKSRNGYWAPEYETGQRMLTDPHPHRCRPLLPFLGGIRVDRLTTSTPSPENPHEPIDWLYHMQRVLESSARTEDDQKSIRNWIGELGQAPDKCRLGVADGHLVGARDSVVTCFGWWLMP
jgi:hypothetical protein